MSGCEAKALLFFGVLTDTGHPHPSPNIGSASSTPPLHTNLFIFDSDLEGI